MLTIVLALLLLVAALTAGAVALGARRWSAETRELRDRLEAARLPVQPSTVHFRELEGLPAPVQRFFRTALTDGQPMVTEVRLRHDGTFNMGEATPRWRPFTSDQLVVVQRPGFDWNGRIAMLPGLPVRVHDAYVAGEGILHASLLGLISVARLQGTDEIATGELMRFLAEATWYPTALLPSQGVRWEPVDERSARATLIDGSVSVTLLFTFANSGLIETVSAEARGRTVEGRTVPTPWQGRFWNYAQRDGMQVPSDGEVAWLLPGDAMPYWRGHMTELSYRFSH
jgi:hypothetical protein